MSGLSAGPGGGRQIIWEESAARLPFYWFFTRQLPVRLLSRWQDTLPCKQWIVLSYGKYNHHKNYTVANVPILSCHWVLPHSKQDRDVRNMRRFWAPENNDPRNHWNPHPRSRDMIGLREERQSAPNMKLRALPADRVTTQSPARPGAAYSHYSPECDSTRKLSFHRFTQ